METDTDIHDIAENPVIGLGSASAKSDGHLLGTEE